MDSLKYDIQYFPFANDIEFANQTCVCMSLLLSEIITFNITSFTKFTTSYYYNYSLLFDVNGMLTTSEVDLRRLSVSSFKI